MDIHRATNTEHNSQSSEKIGKTENSSSRNLNTQMVRQPRFVPLLKGEVRTGDKERMTAFVSCVVGRAAEIQVPLSGNGTKETTKLLLANSRQIQENKRECQGFVQVKETFSSLALSDLLCPKFELAIRSIGTNGSCHFAHRHTTYVSGKDTQAPPLK